MHQFGKLPMYVILIEGPNTIITNVCFNTLNIIIQFNKKIDIEILKLPDGTLAM